MHVSGRVNCFPALVGGTICRMDIQSKYPAMLSVARRYLGRKYAEHAEDAVQTAYMRAHQSGCDKIYTITKHSAINLRRHLSCAQRGGGNVVSYDAQDVPDLARDASESPLDSLIAKEEQEAVRVALRAIPEPQRSALQGFYFDGLKYTEIAERDHACLNTIKTRIHAGVERVRENLLKP